MKAWIVVCRPSAEFNLGQAEAVKRMFDRHNRRTDWRLICLTDKPEADWHLPLPRRLPGWWAVMEAFALTGTHILTGLDSLIVGDIGPIQDLAETCPANTLYGIRDFYYPRLWGSGVTVWRGNWRPLMEITTPEIIGKYRGNQEFTRAAIPAGAIPGRRLAFVHDHVDGIISYKVHMRDAEPRQTSLPAGTRVCCFHGQPRPWDVMDQEPWIKDHLSP